MATTSQALTKRPRTRYSRIWAAVRELGMTSDDLHDIVYRETQKESLTKLTDKQVERIGTLLWDQAKGRRSSTTRKKLPTNEGGRPETQRQRARLYMEAMKIGWTAERVDGLVQHKFGIAKQQWLNRRQCSEMIETFKSKVCTAKKPLISQLISALNRRIEELDTEWSGDRSA